ncbi:MAG: hypothetical protein LIP09_12330 [Bacteroidales bacterium]|nr:hypothetical protein [Bacteroidales bacterium]
MVTQEKIQEAKDWLKANPSKRLKVKMSHGYSGRLFYNQQREMYGFLRKGVRKYGTVFYEWDRLEEITYPKVYHFNPELANKNEVRMIRKYQKLAAKATFDNKWLRDIRNADLNKSLWENHITTGSGIDGKCVSLDCIRRHCGDRIVDDFLAALKNRTEYQSYRFNFNGYDGSLAVWICPNGEINAGFSKEYRGCANGYYYLLINDTTFIGYDID